MWGGLVASLRGACCTGYEHSARIDAASTATLFGGQPAWRVQLLEERVRDHNLLRESSRRPPPHGGCAHMAAVQGYLAHKKLPPVGHHRAPGIGLL